MLNQAHIGGRINEIVKHRNKIAHGNDTAFNIGKRFTSNELFLRYDEMSSYFSHLFLVFEEYLDEEHYKK